MNQPSLTLTLSVTLKPGSQHDMVWLLQAMLAAISRHFINHMDIIDHCIASKPINFIF